MKKWNRAGIAVLFLVMLAVVTGCGKGEENATVVNMGYFNNITHAQALLMKSEGTLESSFGDGISAISVRCQRSMRMSNPAATL